MCVAVPLKVVSIVERDPDGNPVSGLVSGEGVEMETNFALVSGIGPGDYVLVHAGFAIQKLSAEDAQETLAIVAELSAAGKSGPAQKGKHRT